MFQQLLFKFGFFIFAAFFVPVSAQRPCFSGGSIAGAVIGTFIATLAAVGLIFLFWKFYWKRRRARKLCLESHRDAEKAEPYAFDNPGFLPEDPRSTKKDGGGNLFHKTSNDKNSKTDPKGTRNEKKTAWSPLSVFTGNRQDKRQTVDDSCLGEPQRTLVSLRGHDFTGLGFDVSGNMRDGIFVKDVLHRGPAAESGKIAQGDRIISLNVSFRHMVFEDALTILSYASPYEVILELERPAGTTSSAPTVASSPSERLCHPFFRSQSIDDLTQIGKASRQARQGVVTLAKARKVRSLDIPEEVTSEAPMASRQSPGKLDVRHSQTAPLITAVADTKTKGIIKPERTKKPKDTTTKEASIDTVDASREKHEKEKLKEKHEKDKPKEKHEKDKPKEKSEKDKPKDKDEKEKSKEKDEKEKPKEEKEKFKFPKFGIRVLPDMHMKDKDMKDKDNGIHKEMNVHEKEVQEKVISVKEKQINVKEKDTKSTTDKPIVITVLKDTKDPKEKEIKKKDESKTVTVTSKDFPSAEVSVAISKDEPEYKKHTSESKIELITQKSSNPHGHSTNEVQGVDGCDTSDADTKKKSNKSHLGIKLPKLSGGIHLFDGKSSGNKHKRESSESEAEMGKPDEVELAPAAVNKKATPIAENKKAAIAAENKKAAIATENKKPILASENKKPMTNEVQKENSKSSEDEEAVNEDGNPKLQELEEKTGKEKVGLIPKGLKNLKEWKDKIQGDFHRKKRDSTSSNKDDGDEDKDSSEEGDAELSPETRKKKKKLKKKAKGNQEIALDIPEEVQRAGMAAKTNRKSGVPIQAMLDTVENNPQNKDLKSDDNAKQREEFAMSHTSSSDDENHSSGNTKLGEGGIKTTPKRSMKRKAPMPPDPSSGSPISNNSDEAESKNNEIPAIINLSEDATMDVQHNDALELDQSHTPGNGANSGDKKEECVSNHNTGSHNSSSSDSETETNTEIKKLKKGGTTIELNSNQITIHHSPTPGDEIDASATPTESEVDQLSIPDSGENIAQASSSSTRGAPSRNDDNERKAASLGDLSKIEGENKMSVPLERAMSLDLGNAEDPTSGQLSNKKRKAPLPPTEDLSVIPDGEERVLTRKEAKLDTDTFGKRLKKSSDWGTLEEAIRVPAEVQGEKHFDGFIHLKEKETQKTILVVEPETSDNSDLPSTSGVTDNPHQSLVTVNAVNEINVEAVQSPLITSSDMGVSVHVTSSTQSEKEAKITHPDSSHIQQVTTSGAELHEEIDSTTSVSHTKISSDEESRPTGSRLATGVRMKEGEDDSSESEPPDLPTSPVPQVAKYPASTSYHSSTTYVAALPYTPPKSHITEIQVITSSVRDETESSEDEKMDGKQEAIYENMQIIKQHQQQHHFSSNNGGGVSHDNKDRNLKSSPSDSSLSSKSDFEEEVDKLIPRPRPTVQVVNATEKKKIPLNVSTITTGPKNITVMSINTDSKNVVKDSSDSNSSSIENQLNAGSSNDTGARRSSSPHRDLSSTVTVEVAGFSNGRSNADKGKEVIQISSEELDGIMMSHSQFLTQKARHMSTQPAGYEQWIYLDKNGENQLVQTASGSDSGTEHGIDSRNGLQEHHTDRDSSEIIVTENATLPVGPVHSAVVTLPTKSVTQIIVDPGQGSYTVNEGSVSKSIIISNLQLAADRRSPETPVPKLEPPQ